MNLCNLWIKYNKICSWTIAYVNSVFLDLFFTQFIVSMIKIKLLVVLGKNCITKHLFNNDLLDFLL